MTNRQVKICRCIQKYHKLNIVLTKCKIDNYLDLQYDMDPYTLDFSNDNMDESTVLSLPHPLLNDYEERIRQINDVIFTRAIAVAALIISIIALIKP